jgi:hypothetical protein
LGGGDLALPPIMPEFSARGRAKTPDTRNPPRNRAPDANRPTSSVEQRRSVYCDMILKGAWFPRTSVNHNRLDHTHQAAIRANRPWEHNVLA